MRFARSRSIPTWTWTGAGPTAEVAPGLTKTHPHQREGIPMSNPTYGSGDYTDPQPGYAAGSTGATDPNATNDPYATNVPYEPTDPNAPAAGGYATTGTYGTETYVTETRSGGPSTKDVARDEAANVAGEAKYQAKSLVSTATSELKNQASAQQGKLAGTLRGYADQLQGVTQGQPLEAGPLSDLVQQAASRGSNFVSWLENREPADVLDELRRYAQRRPVMFLALCGLAGVVAGRITRGAVAANTSVDSPSPARAADTSYTTTGVDYAAPAPTYGDVTPGSTYGAYTDAPAGSYPTETTYPTDPTRSEEHTSELQS